MEIHRDIVRSLRILGKRRSFAGMIVLCIALGVGVNSAIFSVVNALLLRPLPYDAPEELAILRDVYQVQEGGPEEFAVSSPNFLAWREQTRAFGQLEAMDTTFFNLTGREEPRRIQGATVTAGLFPMLGAKTVLGRTFLPEEDRPGGPLVVVLGHGLWQKFGASRDILRKPIQLDGQSYTVVGVLEPGFQFLAEAELWVPLAMDPADPPQPTSHNYFAVGRLRPGMSFAQARSEMETIAKRLERERPDTNTGWTVRVVPLRDWLVGDIRRALLVLLAAVGFVLLIACANVSNLLLTRAIEQAGEMAVRSALGAGRGALIRQVVIENLALALLGGGLGLLLALAAVRILPSIGPSDVLLLRSVGIDGRVLAFTFALSLLAGVLPALVPALRASRLELHQRLIAGNSRSSEGLSGRRLQSTLVTAEIALALVLLVCAGLMIKSFSRLYNKDPGFDPANVLLLEVSLPDWKYAEPAQRIAFWRQALARVQALPGVKAAGVTSSLPVDELTAATSFIVEGRRPAVPGEVLIANFRRVSPGYFQALSIPLEQGRLFDQRDDEKGAPVVVISREMARRYWPNENPIGKRIQRVRNVPNNPWLTVVGVVGDVRDLGLAAKIDSTFYTPFPQNTTGTMNLVLRTASDPLSLASSVRRSIQEVDRDQPVDNVMTMDQWISNSFSKRRFNTLLLSLFAGLGLTLAVVGIYGVLSYSVTRRRQEMGIRMAFGADGPSLLRLVLWHGLTLTLIGLGLGFAISLSLTRLLASLLYEVQPTDPATFLGIMVGLLSVALLASYLPARRASRLDPVRSLKFE